MGDEWDFVSSGTPQDSADEFSDTVAALPPWRRKGRRSIKISLSRRVVLLGLAGLLVVTLAGGIIFTVYRVSGMHGVNSIATGAGETEATATATTLQQLYTQATSGTPVVDDPLSDDRNSWGVFTTGWGGQCAFTGGAYHLTLSKPGYWLVCAGGSTGVLKSSANFALQVQINIVQGDNGGMIFGENASSAYRIDINSTGAYILYQIQNKQSLILQHGSSPAIKTGLNRANIVTIIVNNSNFYLYVNSQSVTSDKLSAYSQGEGDLEALSPDQPTDVAFSNMKIWTF